MPASRHRILKERLTAKRGNYVCAWLTAHDTCEIMRKSGHPWHIRTVIRRHADPAALQPMLYS
jgi:hypothetical protein